MPQEHIPIPANPERPPLTPHDPPAPQPQAVAWHQALKVIRGGARRNVPAALWRHPVFRA